MSDFLDGWENLLSAEYLLDKYTNTVDVNHHLSLTGGDDYFFDLKCEKDYLRAYRECSPLKSLVGKRAKATNAGILDVYNTGSDNKGSGSEAKSIRAVLKRPNILQTHAQFFSQQNQYIDIFGYCPVLRMRPTGIVDELSSLWNIPPWLFDIKYTGQLWSMNSLRAIHSNYYIFWNGQRLEINFDDLFFIYDDGVGTDHDVNLSIPDSRLLGNEYPVSNIIAAYKTRNTLITKRGAIGILSNSAKDLAGVIPMEADEKNNIQRDFRKYGLVGQPYQVIVTEASLQWQQMGFATRELMLFEEIDDDISRLCESYGWPVELMNFSVKGSFNNIDKKEAYKSAYRDTIIPESDSRLEQLTRGVVSEGANLYLWRDFSHVEVLQQDKKLLADARGALDIALEKEYKNGLITKNQWLKKLGEEEVKDPKFDLYYDDTQSAAPKDPSITA